jgi:hypothetical protein
MPGNNNLASHFSLAVDHCLKVVDLEPKRYSVSIWLVITNANRAVIDVLPQSCAFKITSCPFIIRSVSAAGIRWLAALASIPPSSVPAANQADRSRAN